MFGYCMLHVACCVVLRGAAWCCVVLRGAAWCCVVLRGVAHGIHNTHALMMH